MICQFQFINVTGNNVETSAHSIGHGMVDPSYYQEEWSAREPKREESQERGPSLERTSML